MPTPVAMARLCLTQESGEALDAAVSVARRRGHAQTTSLHAVSALLSLPSSSLREACTRARSNSYSSRMQFKALELCLSVSLDRLPSSAQRADQEPPVSNSFMAAIKRSQANQRRQPENFYVYQQQQQQQALVSTVKVELQNLIISILDDPVVSRVFGEAGFRNCDIKLAILRPINQLFRYKRATPMFLCNLGDDFDMGFRGFSFPFSGYNNWSCYEDDNFKKIGEILVRKKWRNPILVGVSALEVLKNFLETVQRKRSGVDFPVQLCGLSVISIENEVLKMVAESWDSEKVKSRFSEVGKMVEQNIGPGVIINFGDLKALVSDDGVCVDASSFIASEVSRLLEIHDGRVWLIGVALEYDTYLKFVKGFPSVEKDWDLQLLTITSPKSSIGESYSRSSLTESFVPLGGFFSTPDMKITTNGSTHCASRCHLCNEKCNQEVAALSNDGFTASMAYQFPSSLPSWLEKPELSTIRGADMKVNDSMVLSAQVARVQKKWDNICQRLHYAPFLAKPVYSQVPTAMGFQVAQNNLSSHNNADASSTLSGCKLLEPSRLTDAKANATTDASTPRAVISKSMSVKLSQTEESDELGGLRSPLSSVGDGLTSPTSVAPVTTDIGLGINLSTCRVIEKSSSQSRRDPMQDFSCDFPAKSDVIAASVASHASNSSSYPKSGFYGQYDQSDFKNLYTSLSGKIGCQEEAMMVISRTIARRRSGHEKQQGASRRDVWFSFLGSDRLCKKKTAVALAEILYGGTESLICVNLSFEDGRNYTNAMFGWQEKNNCDTKFRGKTIVDHIADELRKNPLSVVYLEDIDKSDPQVQNSLSYALRTGRFSDSHGREVSIGNTVFVTTSRTITGNTIASSIKENSNYLEENVLATKRRPFQIQIGFDLGDNVISRNSKVLNNTRNNDSTPVFMNKRKLVGPDGIIRQHKTPEVVKRAHTTLKLPLDLNLPAEESETTHLENSDGDPLSDNSSSWLQDFMTHVDETVTFKPFDFDALAEEKLKVITKRFHNIVGSEGSLEIDSQMMEQILAAVYLSDCSSSKVDEWINEVLGLAFVEARKRYNLTSRSVVKLVTCEGQEQAPGVFLPAGIIMN